jgi:small subunit ribosomal protein S6
MKYELMVLFKPISTEEVKEKLLVKIEKKVSELGGDIKLVDFIGKKLLAYPVKGHKEGVYVLAEVNLDSTQINTLRNYLNLISDVLRFIIIKLKK